MKLLFNAGIVGLSLIGSLFLYGANPVTGSGEPACPPIRFEQAPEHLTGERSKGVAIADIDGDGLKDIVVSFAGTPNSAFSVLRNLGGGAFAARVTFKLPSAVDETPYVSDIDGAPPAGWSLERKREYFDWAKRVVDQMRGTHAVLEARFDAEYAKRP